jgi:uncharacterized radical SAM superfamily Fe-S cluster-containing enzyme
MQTKKTKSLCPECLKVIDAEIIEKDGKVLYQKTCPEHGEFFDTYWSDVEAYERFEKFSSNGDGVENPNTKEEKGCPYDCGLCPNHKTTTILANLDLTNRCDQRCPICFANSAAAGYLYEPTDEQIYKMLKTLRAEKPVPCPAVQFSGGEPTTRNNLPEIIKMARKLGFVQVQIATNGKRLAHDLKFCRQLKKAGLNTIYLQFDGLREDIYEKIRGYNALPNKLKAIENCRKAGLTSVILVPTIARGTNDDQIGEIVKFAAKNLDVVRGVNFQPISFSGRVEIDELRKMRITIPDVFRLLGEQTDGQISKDDFYPTNCVLPISHLIESWKRKPQIKFTIHPHCGAATYLFVEDGKFIPITKFVDADKFFEFVENTAKKLDNSIFPRIKKMMMSGKIIKTLPKFIDSEKGPQGLDLVKLITNIFKKGSKKTLAEFHRKSLFIGTMHFQDVYNFDLERVKRCGIHYVTPDCKIIPFCSYNAIHREKIEKKFSKPL